jgi:hypothetical protein
MKYAWIQNDRIRDIAPGNPSDFYHHNIAKFYNTEVPDDAQNGDGWINEQLVKPELVVSALVDTLAPVPPKVSPVQFMLLFTSAERVAIKTARATDPVIDDWLDIIEDSRLTEVDLGLASTAQALDYLVSVSLLTEGRKIIILTGQLQ